MRSSEVGFHAGMAALTHAPGRRLARVVMILVVLVGLSSAGCASATPLVRTATVELDHCGFKPLDVDGKLWEVVAPPFDATNAPDQWQGRGEIVALDSSRLIFGDASGLKVTPALMTNLHS